jgi:hypothetical protein
LDEENAAFAVLAQENGFSSCIIVHVAVAGKWCNSADAPAEKSVINMI